MSTDPKTFEKRGKAYVGFSAAVKMGFGEVIILAPTMDALESAFSAMTCGELDREMVKSGALIAASRVAKNGAVKP